MKDELQAKSAETKEQLKTDASDDDDDDDAQKSSVLKMRLKKLRGELASKIEELSQTKVEAFKSDEAAKKVEDELRGQIEKLQQEVEPLKKENEAIRKAMTDCCTALGVSTDEPVENQIESLINIAQQMRQ